MIFLLKRKIYQAFSIINRRIKFIKKNTVFIDGGLGSQILSILFFWSLQDSVGDNHVFCNLDYFDDKLRKNKNGNIGLRNWKLSVYGINKESISIYRSKSRIISHLRKINPNNEENYSAIDRKQYRQKYLNKFPINEKELEKFYLSLPNFKIGQQHAVTHMRRGDFVQIASHVVPYSSYLNLISSLSDLLPNYLIFFSDSEVPEHFRESISEIVKERTTCIYIDDPEFNEYVIHDCMRMSNMLITGNSTFSFSAALLGREGQVKFSPLKFESGRQLSYKSNLSYQSAGRFFIWEP